MQQDLREHKVLPEQPAQPVRRDLPEQQALPDQPDQPEHKGPQGLPELQEQLALPDQPEPRVRQVQPGQPARPGQPVPWAIAILQLPPLRCCWEMQHSLSLSEPVSLIRSGKR